MSEITNINVKLSKRMKELFLQLCKEEDVDISHAIRELIAEALARRYIVKERKERLQKIKANSQ